MDIQILEKKENPTLSRTELELKLAFTDASTPSKEDLKKEIAKQEKAAEDAIVVNSIHNAFGAGVASAQVTIYKSKKDLERIEQKPKEVKAEGEKKEAAPAKEEAPKEEKTDAPKEEKKEDTPETKEDKPAEEAKKESSKEKKE